MDRILLIDAANFIYRAVFVFKPPSSTYNADNSVPEEFVLIYNFFRNLRAITEQFAPAKLFFVLEGRPQFRYDLYPEYKANRLIKTGEKTSSREKVHKAFPEIIRLLKYLPITTAKAEHYECDDTISALAEDLKDEEVIIISNDTDFIQLLQKGYKNLKIYNSTKKEFMVAPTYPYAAFKSLTGDKSDNIDGLCGKVKAEKFVKDPDKLQELLSLEENRAKFATNLKLIQFADVPMEEIILEDGKTDFEALKIEFEKMAFQSILAENYWAKFKATFNSIKF